MSDPLDPVVFTHRLAPALLRLARDPRSGQLPRRTAFDVAIRAALLCELGLDAAIETEGGTPVCEDPDAAAYDGVLYALADAIYTRPGVSWRRWYTHVDTDRAAITATLLDEGIWEPRPEPGRPAYEDRHSEESTQMRARMASVRLLDTEPGSPRESILGFLLDLGDGERARPAMKKWRLVLAESLRADPSTALATNTVLAALQGAGTNRRVRGFVRR